MEMFVHEITLAGDSEFATKFNKVSEAYSNWQSAVDAGEPNEKELFQVWFDMKFALEQGLPL